MELLKKKIQGLSQNIEKEEEINFGAPKQNYGFSKEEYSKIFTKGTAYINPLKFLVVPLLPFVLDIINTNVFNWKKLINGTSKVFDRNELVSLLYMIIN